MRRYEKYKPSGVEWLGEIPEHWEVKRVKDIFREFGSGTTPSTANVDYYEDGNVNWLNTNDLSNDLIYETKQKITKKAQRESGLKTYPVNSLAIAMYGQGKTRGTVGLLQVPSTTNQASCIMFKPIKTNTKYVLYWFIHKYEDIRSLNTGATQPNMNQDFVKFLTLHFPLYEEQTAIANYLDTKTAAIDRKIELLTAKTAKYNALRRSLINETVCRGLKPNALLKDSGIEWIGKIPAHWEVKGFKEIARTVKGKNLDLSDTYFDKSLPNLSLDFLRNDSITFDTFCYTTDKNQRVTTNDMIIIWDGAGVGEILKGKDGFLSSTIAKIVVDNKKYDKNFLYHLRFSIEYVLKMIPAGMGIPHLNPQVLNSFDCPCPPLIEQLEIAQYLDNQTSQIDTILSNISNQIGKLTQLRKTLINDVVTGKIKVTED